LARYPNIKNVWPAYGIPELFATDNGMDLHAEPLGKTCQEMGIQILYCPAATPEHKGGVERHFRTLAEDLIHRLPGTVFSNIDARGDYPSEDVACIDLELLIELIVTWIVDIYNITYHRGIHTSPLLKWQESAAKRIIELPVFPQQLDVLTGIPATRTLFHYGLELDGLHYNSRRLQDIRRRSGENLRVQLKFYEDSVAHVHVFDPYAKEYLLVPIIQTEYAQDLPRSVHRMIREHARRQFGEQFSASQLDEVKQLIQNKIAQALKEKKMGIRKKGARLTFHDSESVFADQDLLAAATKPVMMALPEAPTDLPSGLEDELPSFKPIFGEDADCEDAL
jgi:putative transposase